MASGLLHTQPTPATYTQCKIPGDGVTVHPQVILLTFGGLTPSTGDVLRGGLQLLREGLKEILDDETQRQQGKAWFWDSTAFNC